MLFRAQELRQDTLGVLSSWADGGYSDDLTVASKCNEAGKKVWCPSYAIFPQWYADFTFFYLFIYFNLISFSET